MGSEIKVLIADDHAVVRMGLSALLGAANRAEAVAIALRKHLLKI